MVARPRPSSRFTVLAAVAACLACLAIGVPAAAVADTPDAPALEHSSSDLVVGTSPSGDPVGGQKIAPHVELVPHEDRAKLAGADVRYVEPNHTFKAAGLPSVLNDPLFVQQWPLATTKGISAPGAWWTTQGRGAVIAVLDSGIDASHKDLAGNLWVNTGEIPGNGIDDDHDGFVDDVNGANVVAGNNDIHDGLGHGTAMAGAAAAVGGNGIGTAGVAPQAKIMPVKVLNDDGTGTTASVISGILYAVRHGATVINLSLNGPDHSQALDDTLAYAKSAGVTVVASAGNDGANRDSVPSYPASAPNHEVISVAAGSEDGGLTTFSGYGHSVDLAAPGEDVLSTARGGTYAETSGSSVAAAQTSGVIALLAAARPGSSPDQLRAALLAGTRPLKHDLGRVATGRLDAAGAMARLVPGAVPKVRLASKRLIRSKTGRVALTWRARGAVGVVAKYRVRIGRYVIAVASSNRARIASAKRVLRLRPGRYRWTVTAYDASGNEVATRSSRVKVSKPARKHKHAKRWKHKHSKHVKHRRRHG